MSDTVWRARTLLTSPHRLCFFWGGVQWVASALWWFAVLLRAPGLEPVSAELPAVTLHALWFSIGSMPLFIAGFLFTAGPKWLAAPVVEASRLRSGVAAFSAGWLLTGLAATGGLDLPVAAAGLWLAALGLAHLVWRSVQMLRRARRADALHPRLIVTALGVMVLAHGVAAAALSSGQVACVGALALAALWWGPVAVFIVASHRLLPFLGDGLWPALERRWPRWPLWLLLSAALVQGARAAGPDLWPLGGLISLTGLMDVHLGIVCLASAALTLRWWGTPALKSPLVRMLFTASLWWLLALALLAAGRAPVVPPDLQRLLQLAGLHALTLGYLGGTLLVMATRVTVTHQGRSPLVDRHGKMLFLLLQVAVALRVAAALWPDDAGLLTRGASLAWLLLALSWLLRHGGWLGRGTPARPAGPFIAADSDRSPKAAAAAPPANRRPSGSPVEAARRDRPSHRG